MIRPIWITEGESQATGLPWIHSRYQGAPLDPRGEVLDVITMAFGDQSLGRRHGVTEAILKALGMPGASP